MTLAGIVRVLGGELSAGGQRASVPGPGHGPRDRSVSLLLAGDRVIVHGFAGEDWRQIRDHLYALGLVDRTGRLASASARDAERAAAASASERIAAAHALWTSAGDVEGTPAARHGLRRAVRRTLGGALRFHPAAPSAVYAARGWRRPALLAAIRTAEDRFTGVEVTYLTQDGAVAPLRTPRKIVGRAPPGSAVRLDPAAGEMLVAEGVFSALSASDALGLPAWACLSADNLARWSPPAGVDRVCIAADRGRVGEARAAVLHNRLRRLGLRCEICLPTAGDEDWNAAAQANLAGQWRGGSGLDLAP